MPRYTLQKFESAALCDQHLADFAAGEEDLRSDPLFAEYRRGITHLLRSSRQAALETGRD